MKKRKSRFRILNRYFFFVILIILYVGYLFAGRFLFTDIPEDVVGYCREKYGRDIDFSWVEFNLEKSGTHSKVSIVSDGNVTFEVNRYYDINDKVNYSDNYLGVLSEDYINSTLKNILGDTEFTISIEDSIFVSKEDCNIKVEDYLLDTGNIISLSIKDTELWSREDVDNFIKQVPFRVSVLQESNDGSSQHFATTSTHDVVFR